MKKKYYYKSRVVVSFYVIDARATPTVYINPDSITINGGTASYMYNSSTHLITMSVPASGSFAVVVGEAGYVTSASLTYTANILNGDTIQLVPESVGEYSSLISWNQSVEGAETVDFDSHMLIFDGATKLGETYYPSEHKVFTDSNTVVTLDHDDTSGQYNGNETTTINPYYNNYKYVFVVLDFSHKSAPSSAELTNAARNLTCQYVVGSSAVAVRTSDATVEAQGQYWEVFEINNGVVTVINKITDVNTYGITV